MNPFANYPVTCDELEDAGLFDELEDAGLFDEAEELALELARRTADIRHANFLAEKARREDLAQHCNSLRQYLRYLKAKKLKPN